MPIELPVKRVYFPDDTVLVSVSMERWDEDAKAAGETNDRDMVVENELWDMDELERSVGEYGFAQPSSQIPHKGVWFSSIDSRQDREYFEEGVEKYYHLHIHKFNGRDPEPQDYIRIADAMRINFNRVWASEEKLELLPYVDKSSWLPEAIIEVERDSAGDIHPVGGNIPDEEMMEYINGSENYQVYVRDKDGMMYSMSIDMDGESPHISYIDRDVYISRFEKLYHELKTVTPGLKDLFVTRISEGTENNFFVSNKTVISALPGVRGGVEGLDGKQHRTIDVGEPFDPVKHIKHIPEAVAFYAASFKKDAPGIFGLPDLPQHQETFDDWKWGKKIPGVSFSGRFEKYPEGRMFFENPIDINKEHATALMLNEDYQRTQGGLFAARAGISSANTVAFGDESTVWVKLNSAAEAEEIQKKLAAQGLRDFRIFEGNIEESAPRTDLILHATDKVALGKEAEAMELYTSLRKAGVLVNSVHVWNPGVVLIDVADPLDARKLARDMSERTGQDFIITPDAYKSVGVYQIRNDITEPDPNNPYASWAKEDPVYEFGVVKIVVPDVSGAAFTDTNPKEELVRVLSDAANRIRGGELLPLALRDLNGNAVGEISNSEGFYKPDEDNIISALVGENAAVIVVDANQMSREKLAMVIKSIDLDDKHQPLFVADSKVGFTQIRADFRPANKKEYSLDSVSDAELPGMWERADFTGGQFDL